MLNLRHRVSKQLGHAMTPTEFEEAFRSNARCVNLSVSEGSFGSPPKTLFCTPCFTAAQGLEQKLKPSLPCRLGDDSHLNDLVQPCLVVFRFPASILFYFPDICQLQSNLHL
jgi:hypothetical protein